MLGVVQLRNASVDMLPEFGLPQVQVQTAGARACPSAEVEQLITIPLEDEFNGLPFLNTLRSQSVPGLSAIELTFNAGTDIYRARQLVTERVAQGPSIVNVGTPPVMIQPLSSTARVMMIGLSSKSVSPINMSTLARWRIRPRLLAVPGVANVTIWGQRDQQLQVLVDPAKLVQNGVTLDQIINTTGDAMWTSPLSFVEASSPGADGFIDTPNQRISLQHILPISKPKDLAEVPIEDVLKGPQLTLGQVTTVVEDHPAMRGDAVLPGGPGFLLVVEKFPDANTLAVTKGVQDAMAALEPGLTGDHRQHVGLPAGDVYLHRAAQRRLRRADRAPARHAVARTRLAVVAGRADRVRRRCCSPTSRPRTCSTCAARRSTRCPRRPRRRGRRRSWTTSSPASRR